MMIRKLLARLFSATFLVGVISVPAHADLIVYDGGDGLSATADYSIVGNTLTILLTNTSTSPFGGQDGSAGMVLSSLNFDLPTGFNIVDGSAALGAGSQIVQSTNTTSWSVYGGAYDLNDQYGFSNTGVGNIGSSVYLNATSAVTSHNNGGSSVTSFDGATGIANNGLDWGLVADGTSDVGNNRLFVQDSVLLTLTLNSALSDLSFLNSGSYVEFGSDYSFIRGHDVPEPTSLLLFGVGALGLAFRLGRGRKLSGE